MTVEDVERDDAVRLRDERAGGAGISRGDRVNRDETFGRRDAERARAQAVRLQGAYRETEGRLDETARQNEQNEENDETVKRRIALAHEVGGERPSTGLAARLSPSAPPVAQALRLASSPSSSAMPRVTISRVRSEPRSRSGAVIRPSAPAIRLARTRPISGSATPALARIPAPRRRRRRRPPSRARRRRRSPAPGRATGQRARRGEFR
jgi:hypothetical protein